MVSHNSIAANSGARSKVQRLGRGTSSGRGSKSGRGTKGQNARAGAKFRLGEQTTYLKQIPKLRGFTAINPRVFRVVNLADLQALATAGVSTIDIEALVVRRIIRKNSLPLKVLGTGDIASAVHVSTNAISTAARAKIEKAGGSVTLL